MSSPEDAGFELAEHIQERGNFGYTIAAMLGKPKSGRAPLGIAAFLAIPLFFCSLMASTLAQERPTKIQWHGCKSGICTVWFNPSTANEAHIWLWALVPSVILVVVGFVAAKVPLGFYVSCLASIVLSMAVVHKTAIWQKHHIARFPMGIDLVPDHGYAFSNQWSRGQWEREARATALSFQHWTIGIALAAMLVMALLWVRSRYFSRRPEIAGVPAEGMHAPDATMPGL